MSDSEDDIALDDLDDLLESCGPVPPPMPPPPPDASDVPPPPPEAFMCVGCNTELSENVGNVSMCPKCRLLCGDPFRTGMKLLDYKILDDPSQARCNLICPASGLIDFQSGAMPVGQVLEIRALRIDAPSWRYVLKHAWPEQGVSLFVDNQRILLVRPKEEDKTVLQPADLSGWVRRQPFEVNPRGLDVSCSLTFKKGETWIVGLAVITEKRSEDLISFLTSRHTVDYRLALGQVKDWFTANMRGLAGAELRSYQPPVIRLQCPISMMRIERAAKGLKCEHLGVFDLISYIHTMKNTPPKAAWLCPHCGGPAPPHLLRLDDYAQNVLDTNPDNVAEVEVKHNGQWKILEYLEEDDFDDDDDEIFEAPNIDLVDSPRGRSRSRSPRRSPAASPETHTGSKIHFSGSLAGKPSPSDEEDEREKRKKDKGFAMLDRTEIPVDHEMEQRRAARAAEKLKKQKMKERQEKWAAMKDKQLQEKSELRLRQKVGWVGVGHVCSKCNKTQQNRAGVFCGRARPGGDVVGCHEAICWKCMKSRPKHDIGGERTSMHEFEQLEAEEKEPWWMHERCMSKKDQAAYWEEDEDEVDDEAPVDDEEEHDGNFA